MADDLRVSVQTPTPSMTPPPEPVRRGSATTGGASRRTDRDLVTRMAAAVLSGLLLFLAFPPADVGVLAFVALIPLLWAWRDAGPGRAAGLGFLTGLVFMGTLCSWVWYFGTVALVPFLVLQALYFAVAGAIVGGLARFGVRSVWVTAAAWTLLEAVRGRWPLGGFAWGEVGDAMHDVAVVRTVAAVGGVALLSFVIVLVNGLLLDAGLALRDRPRGNGAVAFAVGGLALVVALVAAAPLSRSDLHRTGSLRFALLQGNDQDRYLTQSEIDSGYLTRRHLALAAKLRGRYDLIVFPESALENDPEQDPALRARIVALAAQHHSAVLVNAIVPAPGHPGRFYNADRWYDADGTLQGTYAKRHLVPFGEYLPFRNALSWIPQTRQLRLDFLPGSSRRLFTLPGRGVAQGAAGSSRRVFTVAEHRVANIICFENAFGEQVRPFVDSGAEVIVVNTNNRSYRHSANAAQHVALSQMRAAELGRAVLHASISGITAVVDDHGGVHQQTRLFHNATVTGSVTTMAGRTWYARFGDWVLWGSALTLLGAFGYGLARRRRAS
jgi:apolipoprotein N-acyltransferase